MRRGECYPSAGHVQTRRDAVQGGLRRVLETQAKRLQWLASRRYEALGGAASVAKENDDD